MADFGQVRRWLRGYLRHSSVLLVMCSGWKYLKRLGWTLQTPRPQHQAAATSDAQQTFKKNLRSG